MTFIEERTKVVWEEKLPKVNFFSAKLFPKVVVLLPASSPGRFNCLSLILYKILPLKLALLLQTKKLINSVREQIIFVHFFYNCSAVTVS